MIQIIGIGKTKDRFLLERYNEYLKRLAKYAKVEFRETNTLPETDSFTIALDEKGREFTSLEFSDYLKKKNMSEKKLTFVLGPAEGFSKEFLQRCPEKISLSKMTFPHELARLFFLEQVYRAFTIMNHEPYHK